MTILPLGAPRAEAFAAERPGTRSWKPPRGCQAPHLSSEGGGKQLARLEFRGNLGRENVIT